MTDGAIEDASPSSSKNAPAWIDVLTAIVLSATALLTAYASYQAALWDGEQAARYVESAGLRVESSRAGIRAGQEQGADLMTFGAWLNARADRDDKLEEFLRRRFRPEFRPAFEAWLATEPARNSAAPPTPFVMPNYRPAEYARSEALERAAHRKFEEGQTANARSDSFVLATVILANALFFGGISQVTRQLLARKVLLFSAIAFCILGLIRIVTLPSA